MKIVAYRLVHRVGAVDIFVAPLPHPGIEISKKKFDRKMKIITYRSEYHVGTVDTSVAPVPHPEIEISKKKYGPKKKKDRIPFRAPRRCR